MTARRVTLVIHGTFAAGEQWWRLGEGGAITFADRLEAALAARGVVGTVWRPALEHDLGYAEFSWSGRNRHAERRRGGRSMAEALSVLAARSGATPAHPLRVDIVAHSHGGNVVLEALRWLPANVAPGVVVLLGTPLIARRPALRLVRLLLAVGLAAVLGALVLAVVLAAFGMPVADGVGLSELVGLSVVGAVSYGWLFVGAGWLMDQLWGLVGRAAMAMSGRAAGQAYGPPPRRVGRLVGRITLVSSHDDEADLVLKLGAAPGRLYHDWVIDRFRRVGRVLEVVFLRPFVVGIVLPAASVMLERYVLGFPWWLLMMFDHEMADLDAGRAYPPWLLRRVDVTRHLLPLLTLRPDAGRAARPLEPPRSGLSGADRRAMGLRHTLVSVGRDLAQQVRLRHSMYYESDEVVRLAAEAIAQVPVASSAA